MFVRLKSNPHEPTTEWSLSSCPIIFVPSAAWGSLVSMVKVTEAPKLAGLSVSEVYEQEMAGKLGQLSKQDRGRVKIVMD